MLGRGLESLIPKKNNIADQPGDNQVFPSETPPASPPAQAGDALSRTNPSQSSKKVASESIFQIEVEKIFPNPHQPRRNFNPEELRELASSIREFGIIQPLLVSKLEKETETGTSVEYQLIAGERRLQAAKMAGLERVPVIIRKLTQKAEGLELAIIENLQRANLDSIETARAYSKLQDEFGLTQREIAARLGKSRETIANALRLLNLSSEIQDAIGKNQINESQARMLLAISDINEQQKLFKEILSQNLTVREIRSRINKTNQGQTAENQAQKSADPEIISMENQLKELLGAPVKIEKKDNSGKIIIDFYSPEEIQGIIQKLNPHTNI
jgi:ParB family chromosome partitioning protein